MPKLRVILNYDNFMGQTSKKNLNTFKGLLKHMWFWNSTHCNRCQKSLMTIDVLYVNCIHLINAVNLDPMETGMLRF